MNKTKVMSKATTKQKVVTGVVILAISAGVFGILSAAGYSQGYGFGWPFVRTAPSTITKSITVDKTPQKAGFFTRWFKPKSPTIDKIERTR